MKQEKRFLSNLDTVGVDGFWIDDSNPDNLRTVEQVEKHYQEVIQRMEESVDHNAVQDRLNRAHAIGFKDGVKAADLISNQQINALRELIHKGRLLLFMANYLEDPQIIEYLKSTEEYENV